MNTIINIHRRIILYSSNLLISFVNSMPSYHYAKQTLCDVNKAGHKTKTNNTALNSEDLACSIALIIGPTGLEFHQMLLSHKQALPVLV